MHESTILRQIRTALNETGRVRLWRNNVGIFYTRAGTPIRIGQAGSPDLWGPIRGSGALFAIEIKRPGGRVSPEQTAFWAWARKWGVRGGFARSVDEALQLLTEAER